MAKKSTRWAVVREEDDSILGVESRHDTKKEASRAAKKLRSKSSHISTKFLVLPFEPGDMMMDDGTVPLPNKKVRHPVLDRVLVETAIMREIDKLGKRVEKARKEYRKLSKLYLKLLKPTTEEIEEAEEGAYSYYEDHELEDHLDSNEILADIIIRLRD